jgi:hypothetical protein
MPNGKNDYSYTNWFDVFAKIIFVGWAVLTIGYFYYSRGYVELFRQLGALIIG